MGQLILQSSSKSQWQTVTSCCSEYFCHCLSSRTSICDFILFHLENNACSQDQLQDIQIILGVSLACLQGGCSWQLPQIKNWPQVDPSGISHPGRVGHFLVARAGRRSKPTAVPASPLLFLFTTIFAYSLWLFLHKEDVQRLCRCCQESGRSILLSLQLCRRFFSQGSLECPEPMQGHPVCAPQAFDTCCITVGHCYRAALALQLCFQWINCCFLFPHTDSASRQRRNFQYARSFYKALFICSQVLSVSLLLVYVL